MNHPHICIFYDVGPNYLLMELCEGETLAARLKRGKLSIDETVRYGSQISAHGPRSVWIVDPDTGEARLAVQFPEGYQFYFRAAWTSDGKSVVVNKATSNSRIVLLENFE